MEFIFAIEKFCGRNFFANRVKIAIIDFANISSANNFLNFLKVF